MLRRELLEQLRAIKPVAQDQKKYDHLIEDIEDNGVLDIQCPDEVAESLGLDQ